MLSVKCWLFHVLQLVFKLSFEEHICLEWFQCINFTPILKVSTYTLKLHFLFSITFLRGPFPTSATAK